MISIIVTYHNIGWLIGRCLESISAQTYKDYEVILIDNGSDDKSKTIVDEVSDGVENLHYYYIKHQNDNAAINYGIDKASGNYLYFLDGCDFLNSNALHCLYWSIIRSHSDMIAADYTDVGAKTRTKDISKAPVDYYVNEYTPTQMLIKMHGNTAHADMRFNRLWNKLFKRNLFDDVRLEDDMGSEIRIMKDIVLKCQVIGVVAFMIYFRTEIPKCDDSVIKTFEDRLEFFKQNIDKYGTSPIKHIYSILVTNLLYMYKWTKDAAVREKCLKRVIEILKEHPEAIPNKNQLQYVHRISKSLLTRQ